MCQYDSVNASYAKVPNGVMTRYSGPGLLDCEDSVVHDIYILSFAHFCHITSVITVYIVALLNIHRHIVVCVPQST